MKIQTSHMSRDERSQGLRDTIKDTVPPQLLDRLYEGVYEVDGEGTILFWNRGAEELSGYPRARMIGTNERESLRMHIVREPHEEDRVWTESMVKKTLADGVGREDECAFLHKDGQWMRVRGRTIALRNDEGDVTGALMVFSDTVGAPTMRRRLKELRRLALSDPLTGLGNRRYGEMSLRVRIDEMKRYGWPFGVLFIDLDQFKKVNDTFGHEIGDRALKTVAETLSRNVRPFDVVCRWGGEEFLAIITNINLPQLLGLAEKLRSLAEQATFTVGPRQVAITISIGATVAREKDTEKTLLERADRLMYIGKRAGKNRVYSEL
ncbi:MAG: diguanylate cyclase [Chitinivibrionales bacterium]|nr:diguanylate cyclase [Chitinivibrionales bacterium]MBD3356153.1 diguanylate cyclase [Chitinivibrionales bacterium]